MICKNGDRTAPSLVTVTLERNGSIIVIKDVPADVCNNCGQYYLNEAIATQLTEQANAAIERGAEVEVIRHRQAA
ncbi:type II toxin-antitoxin system MqsA family antitoxin [Larkinella sp. VNQ87]|uniref:type II toxin-antitoxin system MqsA family antitoxin n=1 Tax=Larkinella sp. VNQ87 TaxID=3400921 RepID=UPI003C2B20CB